MEWNKTYCYLENRFTLGNPVEALLYFGKSNGSVTLFWEIQLERYFTLGNPVGALLCFGKSCGSVTLLWEIQWTGSPKVK